MDNLFEEPRLSIGMVQPPNFGWKKADANEAEIAWLNPTQTAILLLNFFDLPPDLPSFEDIEVVRDMYRHSLANAGGGILEVNFVEIKGLKAVKTLFKLPQKTRGMVYIGSFIIPFESASFVLKIQAQEAGITGMRDNMVLNKLLKSGKVTFGDAGIAGWAQDPYDATFQQGRLMNLSEAEHYDAEFPEHPLSVVRNMMSTLLEQTVFDPLLYKASVFK
jgi:hypothetical protein